MGVNTIVAAANTSVSHNSWPRRAAGHSPHTITNSAVSGTSTTTKCTNRAWAGRPLTTFMELGSRPGSAAEPLLHRLVLLLGHVGDEVLRRQRVDRTVEFQRDEALALREHRYQH